MSSPAEPWTIGRLLSWTTEYLNNHGAESPRLDAEILLAEARGCQRIDLYTAFDQAASDETRTTYRQLIRRRADGTPVAYLVGRKEFFSLDFEVTPNVLIPRPETELIVVALLDLVKAGHGSDAPVRIADVGTGSGILAVCAAKHLPQATVLAVDVSPPALELARRNAERHAVAQRIEFAVSDLFENVRPDDRFNFIVSNPPYVSTDEMSRLPREVRDHEPHSALHAGQRGTEVVELLLPQAAARLTAGGGLLIEVSPMIAAEVEHLVNVTVGLRHQQTIRDHAGHARVVQAEKHGDE